MICVECKPDVALVNALGVRRREIIHAGNKSRVCKKLEKGKRLKGLVDQDPLSVQPPYIGRLKVIYDQQGIEMRKDTQRGNYLIILKPRLEEWILKAAKEARVDIAKYGLPDNGEKLHRVINTNLAGFRRLLEELIGREAKMINALKGVLIAVTGKSNI